ncbi:hypothetical protein HG530_006279 [Fusarium avenaceum]|nr:hypothetical protein HG530_006279 [Fusarium avenaceum]
MDPSSEFFAHLAPQLFDRNLGLEDTTNASTPCIIQCLDLSPYSCLPLLPLQVHDIDLALGSCQLMFKCLKFCLKAMVA